MSRNFSIISSLALAVALAACGGATGPYSNGNPPPPPPPPAPRTVLATPSLAFTPSTLTINAGETATFTFGAVAHNVTFNNRDATTPADIPGNNSSVSITRTFATAGTYTYHCTIHPNMTGKVVVQ